MPLPLNVVVRGHRRKQPERGIAQLLGPAQDNLRSPAKILDGPLDFNLLAFQLVNVSQLFKIGRENDHNEWARLGVVAEIEELGAVAAIFYVQHGSTDALSRAHMPAGFREPDAIKLGRIGRGANPAQG